MHRKKADTKKPTGTLLSRFANLVVSMLSSKWTPWVIVFLFIVNALWVALLYRFPLVYDEQFHFFTIEAFSNFITPIIVNQPPQYDALGSLTFGSASLYHYFLSFVYRFVELFTVDQAIQVVVLRVMNVLMAASGMVIFFKFFRELGIKSYLVNIGMFVFAFLPMQTNVAATINYDNVIFPLTALFFLYSSRLLLKKKPDPLLIVQILTVGTLASLIKFTFLALFVVALIYLVIILVKESYGWKKLWASFKDGLRKTDKVKTTVWVVILSILLLLAGFRYGVAMVMYHTPIPDCTVLMEKNRCEASIVFNINQTALDTKDERDTVIPSKYTQNWLNVMIGGFAFSGVNTVNSTEGKTSPPIYATMLTIGLSMGILVLIYMWRSLKIDRRYTFAILSSLFLLLATLLFNISSYYQYHADLNVQPRYALSVLPIILVFSVLALNALLNGHRVIKVALLFAMLFITTQGGGIITHISVSNDNWYWGNPTVQNIQKNTREMLLPLVKDQ